MPWAGVTENVFFHAAPGRHANMPLKYCGMSDALLHSMSLGRLPGMAAHGHAQVLTAAVTWC